VNPKTRRHLGLADSIASGFCVRVGHSAGSTTIRTRQFIDIACTPARGDLPVAAVQHVSNDRITSMVSEL
jgi:hypothetical protein